MSTITLSEMKERILKVMNEYSINGEVVPSTDENRMDYDLRMNSLIDMHQRKMATSSIKAKKIAKQKVFTQYPFKNQISGDVFDITRYEGTTLYFAGSTNPKSFTIQVDGSCTITIEESADAKTYTTLETHTVTITTFGTFETTCGNISPTTDYYVRIKVEGTYHFSIRGIALYEVTFPTDSDVPAYQDYRKYSMPTDFYQLRDIILNGQKALDDSYGFFLRYNIEGRTTLYVPWDTTGEVRINYWAYPTAITDSTSDDDTLDVDDEVVDAIIYGVALELVDDDNTTLIQRLQNRYNEFFAGIDNNVKEGRGIVRNTLFASPETYKLSDLIEE